MSSLSAMWKRRKRAERDVIVLGQQQAQARRADELHRARSGGTNSPLAQARYAHPAQGSLIHLVDADADRLITSLTVSFRDAELSGRQSITASLTMDDFHAITTFARRSSARSLMTGESDLLRHGLTAAAMIAKDRIDWRDIAWSAAYLRLAGAHVVDSPTLDTLFESASMLAEPATSEILRSFVGLSGDDVRAGWMMRVVELNGCSVIVESGAGRFHPTVDLLGVALHLGEILNADGYLTGDPVVGDSLADVWLKDAPGTKDILDETTVASVLVRVLGRPDSPPMEQLFLAYVFELSIEDAAAEFEVAWSAERRDLASLAVSNGCLVALMISRSSFVGVPSQESDASLSRFTGPVRAALAASQSTS